MMKMSTIENKVKDEKLFKRANSLLGMQYKEVKSMFEGTLLNISHKDQNLKSHGKFLISIVLTDLFW